MRAMPHSLRRVGVLLGGLGLAALAAAQLAGVPRVTPREGPMPTDPVGAVRAPEFPADAAWLNTAAPLRLADLRGKVVLLDFWTYCCINCLHILPELAKLEAKWAEELVVIGVHSAKFTAEGETDAIRQAILRYQITHPVLNDHDFRVWRAYGVRAWPSLALLDPEGRVIGMQSGESTFEQLDPAIEAAVRAAEARGTLRRGPLALRLERDLEPRAVLSFPGKVVADAANRRLFIADSTHHRYVIASFDGEIVETIGSGAPGFADGPFETASFRKPQGLAVVGDTLYLADTENHALRAADLRRRTVTTLVGTGRKPTRFNQAGRGRQAALHSPWDVLHHDGRLFVANAGSHQIWVVDPPTAEARPFAGSGREALQDGPRFVPAVGAWGVNPNATAALAQPSGLATDGRLLMVADSETSALRTVDLAGREGVRTLVGEGLFEFGDVDGRAPGARLQHPLAVVWTPDALFVADTYNSKIKRYDLATGELTTFAGTGRRGTADGPADQAEFDQPGGLAVADGRLFVADTNNHTIRTIDLATGRVATLALRGLDRLPAPAAAPAGRLVTLPAAAVRPGTGSLRLDLTTPAGWKLNPEAPVTVTIGPAAAAGTAAPVRLEAARPLVLPVTWQAGRWPLVVEVTAYACTTTGAGACVVDHLRIELPLTVEPGAVAVDVSLTAALRVGR